MCSRTRSFWTGLQRSAIFTAIFLPGVIFIPLFVAILVDRVKQPRLATVYRLILLVPAVIPAAMIFVLWRWLFDFEIGPINVILRDYLHLFNSFNAPQWVGDSPLAIPAVSFVEIWWGLGYHTMFFLAGLASIPKELYRGRESGWRQRMADLFWHVTLPRLQPIMLVLVILRFGSAMAVIDDFIIMGGFNRACRPTPGRSTCGTWPSRSEAGRRATPPPSVGWAPWPCSSVVAILMRVFRNRD